MTQLLVTQKHVDGMHKRFSDILATVTAMVDDVQATLNNSNEPNVEARDSLKPFIESAQKLCNAVDLLSTLAVTKRWLIALESAQSAEQPEHKTMDAVAHLLRSALVMNCAGLSETAAETGNFASAFRIATVEQLANAVAMCSVLQASHETTEKLCADNSIDYAAVTAGDTGAIEALVGVVEKTNGGPVPGLRERLGIPAAVQENVLDGLSQESDADVAAALGLTGPSPSSNRVEVGAAIRA